MQEAFDTSFGTFRCFLGRRVSSSCCSQTEKTLCRLDIDPPHLRVTFQIRKRDECIFLPSESHFATHDPGAEGKGLFAGIYSEDADLFLYTNMQSCCRTSLGIVSMPSLSGSFLGGG